jgi:mannose-1-phosphate guanylyltransferase
LPRAACGTRASSSGRCALLLDELRRHTPELAALLPLLDRGDTAGFFEARPSLSIDEGLLERSDRVAVLRRRFRGTMWAAGTPSAGRGRATTRATWPWAMRTSWTRAAASRGREDGSIVVFGVDDVVVVRSGDITFVASRSRAPDLKALLAQLPDRVRKAT